MSTVKAWREMESEYRRIAATWTQDREKHLRCAAICAEQARMEEAAGKPEYCLYPGALNFVGGVKHGAGCGCRPSMSREVMPDRKHYADVYRAVTDFLFHRDRCRRPSATADHVRQLNEAERTLRAIFGWGPS